MYFYHLYRNPDSSHVGNYTVTIIGSDSYTNPDQRPSFQFTLEITFNLAPILAATSIPDLTFVAYVSPPNK